MDVAAYANLLPEITPRNQPFWDGCAAGELRLQRCTDCGTYRFPDSSVCPNCLSDAATWEAVSGEGTIWSWCTMHQKYFAAFADEVPYQLVYVQLAEGPLVISVLDDGTTEPRLGQAVRAVFGPIAGDRPVLKFAGM
ncbi:MAG: Zn-ribbon domain-containing OB-fold protein [Pseudonocardia sp.]